MNTPNHCEQCLTLVQPSLFDTVADVFCPWCGKLLRESEAKLAQPNLSENEKLFWTLAGGVAVAITVKAIIDSLRG